MLFENIYKEFLKYAEKRHKKQGFYTLTHDFKLHILPYFKEMDIRDIRRVDILNWQDYILEKKFSSSFNTKLQYELSSFLKFCCEKDFLEKNVVLEVERFKDKCEKTLHNVYTLKEFRKFRRGLNNNIYKQFFNFQFFCGTRCGEALALKFSDIKGLQIDITKNLQRRGPREIDTPKNKSSIRTIKISILTYLRLLKLNIHYNLKFGDGDDYFVFGGPKPLAPTTIDRYKHNACLKTNMKEITVHEFRHSYITRQIHKNVPIDVVSRSVGHSKISTTVDIYLHEEKRPQSDLLSGLDFYTLTHNFKKLINLFKSISTFKS